MKISWVILTWNRVSVVQRAMAHNMRCAGRQWDELVWVDNGSSDGVDRWAERLKPDKLIRHEKNLGVAKGYNAAMHAATGDLVVITGCDMLMPNNWLAIFEEYFEKIPETGVACMYGGPLAWVPERARGGKGPGDWQHETVNGLPLIKAMPIGRRAFRKEMLEKHFGYFHEGFGFYGHEDLHWGHRAEKVCDEMGLRYYVIPDKICNHLGSEGIHPFNGMDGKEYWEFKQRECRDPKKDELLHKLNAEGWPYFNPYGPVAN